MAIMALMPIDIADRLQLETYIGVSPAQALTNLPSGIPLGDFLDDVLDRTAWSIRNYIGRDLDVQWTLKDFWGDGQSTILNTEPTGVLTITKAWDNNGVAQTIAPADFTPIGEVIDQWYYTKGPFQQNVRYQIQYILDNYSRLSISRWPPDVVQIQLEMCAMIMKESAAGNSWLGRQQIETTKGGTALLVDLNPRWTRALRKYRKFT